MIKVSVIIVTYNSENYIYDCLNSLFINNDIDESLEVIVVDNCSKDYESMYNKIKKIYNGRVRVISNSQNGGYGQGNNLGILEASAPYILIMNPDVRLSEPIFSRCVDVLENNPKLGLLGYSQRNTKGGYGRSTSWLSTINPYIAEPLRFVTGKLNLFFPSCMFFTGASFFIRKKAFEQIGMFDEKIFMYSEEEDIHGRMLNAGWKLQYLNSLSYIHLHHSVSDYYNESTKWMKNNLMTLCYLGEKRGENNKSIISREIKRTNIIIFIERIRHLLGKGTQSKIAYFLEWKEYLESIKQ